MPNTYTFEVSNIDWKRASDTEVDLFGLHWRVYATDGTNTASTYGHTSVPDPVRKTIADAKAITKAQARTWVANQLGPEEVQAIKDRLDAQLVEIATPTSGTFQPVD